ncbi:hypothetical protein SLH46_02175 [Draconibacterium sp. IB214405]|uniref:hypothetical protein n=1 Tax=Draconibacterium sp. IB214405 TaxID=3097352 RepID=UPI002A137AA8|nr:hypothetical protein [Draconibacterium sp. IB214405]MDX8337971.1 hypothetical protein [Draconibacterium sp. IB214405]
MMKFGKILTIILVFAGLFACNKDDNSVPFEVIGDVFVIKRTIGEEVKYANSYVAWGNQPMSHAEVTTPGGANMTLYPTSGEQNIYAKEPALNEYYASAPVEGNYQFLVINEDITHQSVDLLDFDDIAFTTLTSAEMVDGVLSVQWETNSIAEGYRIRLINQSNAVAFLSQPLPSQMVRLDIGAATASGSWSETPEAGNVYTVEFLTIRYEDDATSNDATKHIQEIAVTEQDITWE